MAHTKRRDSLLGFLGSLELDILGVFWAHEHRTALSIRNVRDEIATRREISFNAVMTVMNRLVGKRLLQKRKGRRSHLYRARTDRAGFEAEVSQKVAEGFVRDFGSVAVAQFVDAVGRVDPERFKELEQLVEARRGRPRPKH